MPDGFSELIDTSNAFFTELAAHNSRDWYEPRKADYVANIKKPAELLADLLAEDISRLTGKAHKSKLFRIHRDVRFSKDKTPYNAHLHLMWSQPEEARPAWFLGSAPDYLLLGVGLMGLNGESLTRYREFIDRQGHEMASEIAKAQTVIGASISDWGPAPLKRVPKPFAPDHPQAELLKRKALALTAPFPVAWRSDGLFSSSHMLIKALLPLWTLLNRVSGADVV